MPKKNDAKKPTRLKPQERKFVEAVMHGKSVSDAYREAGFPGQKNAGVNGHNKLKTAKIANALERRRSEWLAIANINAKELIGMLTDIATSSIEDVIDEHGRFDHKKAVANGAIRNIKKITQTPHGTSVEMYSALEAAGRLVKILGLEQAPRVNKADERELAAVLQQRLVKRGWQENQAWEAAYNEYPAARPVKVIDQVQ